MKFHVDPDIRIAQTLADSFYLSDEAWKQSASHIFAKSWQFILPTHFSDKQTLNPFVLIPGLLPEPMLLSQDDKQLHCLSNVCTHRGNILIDKAQSAKEIRCCYHGRRFHPDGQFKSMPGFEGVQNFPTEADNLTQYPFSTWGPLQFVSLDPQASFEEVLGPVKERLSWLDFDRLPAKIGHSHTYAVQAHWALYCDNYLEGFHIPFVHPGLNQVLDFPSYTYELFPWGSLQLGIAKEGEDCFELPADSPDYGKNVSAYYYWIFPNLMLNFYPWGLSLNWVEPIKPDLSHVHFMTYVLNPDRYSSQVEKAIHTTEMEDEKVVQSVQKGLRSTVYQSGRYSPTMEVAVHHFHRLISNQMNLD